MALQGNLRDFSVNEILQLLGTQKKTGCLMLDWNTERAMVHIADGRIVSTREVGMRPDDPLLSFLLKVHRVSDEQRRGLQTIHRESGRDLEDLLINGRYVEVDELRVYIERQILDDLMRLVRWENGSYRFDPKVRGHKHPLVRLSMEGALIEAARRGDEQKGFVTRFKDPYQLLGVADLPDPDAPLSEEERELFGIIDGQHTVAEVVELAPLSEYEAYEALDRMLQARWLEVVGRRDPGITPLPGPVRPTRPAKPRLSFGRELLFGMLVLAALVGGQLGSRFLQRATAGRPSASDAFTVSQLHNLRAALDLYRRQHGAYPPTVETMVEDDWVTPDQARFPGYRLRYIPAAAAQEYRLELEPLN